MKKILFSTAILAFTFGAIAQKIEVKESNEIVGGGSNNALVVTVYETTKSEVIKAWKSEMKGYDAKVKTNKNGGFADNALIKSLSDNSVDVHITASEEANNTVKLIYGFDLGGAYLSSDLHGDKYHAGKSIVESFAHRLTKLGLERLVSVELKKQSDLERVKQKLIKENNNLHKTIENAKTLISESEKSIIDNEKSQETNRNNLSKQDEAVNTAKKEFQTFNNIADKSP